MAYDATVLAGTQGMRNHQKTDRMLGIALAQKLPVVLFAEGGGGRPGDTDMPIVAGLHVTTFASFARLSGQVPVVGIVAGRCFAGNAALLGCCDVIIATRDSNIGMGGPAMVEGGGLGVLPPEQIGPSDVQSRNGVIDVLVDDEAAGGRRGAALPLVSSRAASSRGSAPDPPPLRDAAAGEPAARLRQSARSSTALVDAGSLLELRAGFGAGIVTALARIEGRPVGMLASNPAHLGGAIDADAADKAARFMQLCDAHGLPIVSLVDTPGFMVGPEIETRGQVRHVEPDVRRRRAAARAGRRAWCCARPTAWARWRWPPAACMRRWPPSPGRAASSARWAWRARCELGYRKELDAAPEGAEREALRERLVDAQYAKGKAINMAATLEIDAVIDPAETRRWLAPGWRAAGRWRRRRARHRPVVSATALGASRSTARERRRVGPVVRLQRRMRGLVADLGRVGVVARSRLRRQPAPHVFDPLGVVACHVARHVVLRS